MPHSIIRNSFAAAGVVAVLILAERAIPEAKAPIDPTSAPTPTIHPPVAHEASQLWMAPSDADRAAAISHPALVHLQAALRLYAQEKYDQAIVRFVAAATPSSPLRDYASYYAGVSELRLERFEEARARFSALQGPDGFLSEAAALGEAEAALGKRDYDDAVEIYERLLASKAIDEPAIVLSLATTALADNDRRRAAEAFLRLYYEFPLSAHAPQAEGPLQTMPEVQPVAGGNLRYKLELGRGERLFGSRRHPEARQSFLRLAPHASGDDAELVALRLAEIDYFQGRYGPSRDALRPFLENGARQAEARFFYLMSQRGLRNYEVFEQLARALARDFPASTWTEESLNNLATYYIQQDQDDEAELVLREMYSRFPRGRYAERAAWKAGWSAFRARNMSDTVMFFESAAANFPRSDYRPAWLYWSARARDALGDRTGAIARYQLTIADYENTYHGRLAHAALKQAGGKPGSSNLVFVSDRAQLAAGEDDYFPPTADMIRTLLALGLYDPAVKELEFAQRKWGDSPAIGATMAWAQKQMAAVETGTRQFALARGSINLMKRAYPQFMAAGGERLPREILTTIFPLSYWDLIKKYSSQHKLDPYLVAALVAQESTFVPDIRSHANAYGLMQLLPDTGRRYARQFKLRYSLRLLTTPEPNVRMGTANLADRIREFGSVYLALASYNAGDTAVRRWIRERPGLPQEEFIDDIPYPETQQYVRRLLGTAEDYRRLYGSQ